MRRQITVLSIVVGVLCFGSVGLAGPQVLEVSPTFLGFSASAGGANPASQVLSIWNSGHAQMGWTVTEGCSWLTVDPNAGSSSGEVDDVNVIVDISGLSAGTYNCQLTVDAGTAANSPQTVGVLLLIDAGDILMVPSEYSTIQVAIDAAAAGDIVIIEPGTYTGDGNRDLDFGGKAITVRSINPEDPCVVIATVIDCNASASDRHRGFYFHNDEGPDSVVAGLTITKGYAPESGSHNDSLGGGIRCYGGGGGPTIKNCVITNNTADNFGGGIYGGARSVINCIITSNSAGLGGGGIAFCSGKIVGCRISGNSAFVGMGGGGLYGCHHGSITNCLISDNWSGSDGGGLTNCLSPVTNCILWGNSPDQASASVRYSNIQGGYPGEGNINANPLFDASGYHLSAGSPCIDAGDPNYVPGLNETDIDGESRVMGGRVDMGVDEFTSGLIPRLGVVPLGLEFEADEGGSNPPIQTLSIGNIGSGTLNWQATEGCSWVLVEPNIGTSVMGEFDDVNVVIDVSGLAWGTYNCQLMISDPNTASSPQVVDVNLVIIGPIIELSGTYFQFSAFEGGANPAGQMLGISNSGAGTLNWEIDEACDWLTVEPNSGSSTVEVDDVTLSVDISGLTKGAYDCNLTVFDPNAENSPQMVAVSLFIYSEELLVPSEYGTIQEAINAAFDWGIIIVEPNTYTGEGNRDLDFAGKAIIVRSIDPEDPCVVAATVIDCNGSGSDPHRGFYFHSGEDGGSVVAGLTIKNGYVHDGNFGGGIYCSGSSPTIENCNIINNLARGLSFGQGAVGGGIYCTGGSDVTLFGCIISGNSAVGRDGRDGAPGAVSGGYAGSGFGGGVYCASNSSVTILNCKIENNLAKGGDGGDGVDWGNGGHGYGGGIFCASDSHLKMEDCVIFSNRAYGGDGGMSEEEWGLDGLGKGAGVYCYSGNIANCLIEENSAVSGDGYIIMPSYGGGIWCAGGTAITNCTFRGNFSGNSAFSYIYGEGGGIYCSGSPTITNCILWGNFAEYGPQVRGSGAIVSYSDVEGGYTGTGNIDADPCFVTGPMGDYYLSQTAAGEDINSPCVDAGSDSAAALAMNMLTTRTDGGRDESIVDMGYHYVLQLGSADVDGDWHVDFFDFGILARQWLEAPGVSSADIAPAGFDGVVDGIDLWWLTECWLDCYVTGASNPNPWDGDSNVDLNMVLSWSPGDEAVNHDVYFGTDANLVANANHFSGEFMGTVADVNFDPCGLDFDTTYYWRVDEVGPRCTTRGDAWSFMTWPEPNINLGLVSWWKFDEGSGTTAYDSASDNDGMLINDPTWTTGQIEGALSFDGVDDYVSFGTGPAITGTGPFSVSAWLKTDFAKTQDIVCQNLTGGPPVGLYLLRIVADGKVEFLISSNYELGFYFQSSVRVDDGLWHHIAGVRMNSTDGEIYIDGGLAGSGSGPAKSLTNVPVWVGGRPGYDWCFEGSIDDVRIYDRALSAEEILQLYLGGL